MGLLSVNNENFDQEVIEHKGKVLVEFGAAWCAPCGRQLPILEKLASENPDTLKVVKVDIDAARDTANYYNVRSVPTIILFRDGKQIGSRIGLTSADKLKELIAEDIQNELQNI